MKKVIKKSKYILKAPLRGKGNLGDIINVRPGYGRYLERFNKAERANESMLEDLEAKKMEWQEHEKHKVELSNKLFEELKKVDRVTIIRKTSQEDRLYSFINKDEIVEFFASKGIIIERTHVIMSNNIKQLGEYPIVINVYGDKDYEIMLDVIVDPSSIIDKKIDAKKHNEDSIKN